MDDGRGLAAPDPALQTYSLRPGPARFGLPVSHSASLVVSVVVASPLILAQDDA
jgi:hypothetical protein